MRNVNMGRAALMAATALGALALSSPALSQPVEGGVADAQQTDTETAEPTDAVADEAEGIVVTGIRASQRASIDLKRDNIAVVDSIVAEDLGKLPDQNVAESLQRIAGVTIERNRGEG